jgi:hypothetical protein
MKALLCLALLCAACKDPADDAAGCPRLAELQVGCLGGNADLQARMRASYEQSCRDALASPDPAMVAAIRVELECTAKAGRDCDALATCLHEKRHAPR